MAFSANQRLREEFSSTASKPVQSGEPLPESVREKFAPQFTGTVAEGIKHLQKAIELDPEYGFAVAYLNLLLRQKANLADTLEEREKLLVQAEELVQKSKVLLQKGTQRPRRLPHPVPPPPPPPHR